VDPDRDPAAPSSVGARGAPPQRRPGDIPGPPDPRWPDSPMTDSAITDSAITDSPAADGSEPPALFELIKSRIRDVPDFPSPGIVFKDITPLLADPKVFGAVIAALADGHGPVDKVAGIEARGFILAAPVACRLGAGFVPVRKQGKLPAATHSQTYELEYGTATVEVHKDAFSDGDRVLIVDDVLATGGTARATTELIRRCGADVACVAVLLELGFLSGRAGLGDVKLRPLLTV
jgi:adenine phosphoribosyltransferase